jgi:hypothetical protein
VKGPASGGKARGCLIGAAVVLVLATTVAGVLGPGLLRRARAVYAPISKMRTAQQDFEAWSKTQNWQEPAEPALSAAQLDRFLALRKELQELEADAPRPRQAPGNRRPSLDEMPAIVGGVSGFVSARLEAFKRAGMTNGEYRYLDRLVYGRWLHALRVAGQDPAMLEQVEREIRSLAGQERDTATAARLRDAARKVRMRKPGPPAGVSDAVHAILLTRAAQVEALEDSPPRRFAPRGQ